jgi:hypothetical protein
MNTPEKEAVRVFLWTLIPNKRQGDQFYLCYDDTAPPWDEENLFYMKDKSGKTWFCHPSNMDVNKNNLYALIQKVTKDYTPQNPERREVRKTAPFRISIAAIRAVDMEELQNLLTAISQKSFIQPNKTPLS